MGLIKTFGRKCFFVDLSFYCLNFQNQKLYIHDNTLQKKYCGIFKITCSWKYNRYVNL